MDGEDGDEHNPTAKEILSVLKTLILKNPVFVLISTAVSVQSFLISGGTAFNAKIALFQYRLTASEVSVYYGLSTGLGAIIGNTAGIIAIIVFSCTVPFDLLRTIHSPICSLTSLLTHSFSRSLTNSLIHIHSFTQLFIQSFIHSLTHSLTPSFTLSLTYSLT